MNNYTVCPTCGYKLLKASEGSTIEVTCPKCGEKMTIEISNGKVIIQKILSNKSKEIT